MVEEIDISQLPKKGEHRQRAHCNPLSDAYIKYPRSPDYVDWSLHYPHYFERGLENPNKDVELHINTDDDPIDYSKKQHPGLNGFHGPHPDILDIGCGFGGLSFALAAQYPGNLILGMEIREKVAQFVGKKVLAMRNQHKETRQYRNVSCVRTNSMKFLTNYIRRNSVDKIFICFPDPHFKRSNWPRRIITPQLLSIYAYVLKNNGRLYFVSDVRETFEWMQASAECHPFFNKVLNADDDFGYKAMQEVTEEGQKAIRGGETIYAAVYSCNKIMVPEPERAPLCEYDRSSSSEGFVSVNFIPTSSPPALDRPDISKYTGKDPWHSRCFRPKRENIHYHKGYRAIEKWRRASGLKHKKKKKKGRKSSPDQSPDKRQASSSSPTSQESLMPSSDSEHTPPAFDDGNEAMGPGRKPQTKGCRLRNAEPKDEDYLNLEQEYHQEYTSNYASGYPQGYPPNYAQGYPPNYAQGYPPNYAPGHATNYASGHASNYAPAHASNYAPGHAGNYAAGHAHNYAPGHTPNYAPGHARNYAPGHTPNYAAGHAPN